MLRRCPCLLHEPLPYDAVSQMVDTMIEEYKADELLHVVHVNESADVVMPTPTGKLTAKVQPE